MNWTRPRLRLSIWTVTLIVFWFPFWTRSACGQKSAPVERRYGLPCEVTSFAQSGDGATIWAVCQDQSLRKQWEMDAAEARKKRMSPPPPPATSHARTAVYAVELPSGRITPLANAEGRIEISAAPVGTKMVLVLPQESGSGQPVLYEGTQRVAELSIDPSLLIWSADATKIYFYAGSTIQTDAWNILGVLRLNGLVVSHEKLLESTESVHICAADGHLFTGDPIPNNKRKLEANSVEYDSDLKFIRRVTKFIPGNFSASCRYVATEQSYHGPLSGEIIDVATGEYLKHLDFTGEEEKEEFEFESWNPKSDDIFLRSMIQPIQGAAVEPRSILQVFNLAQGGVLRSFDDISGKVLWSNDGQSIVFSRGNFLVFRSIIE
jgi:hypothetical protein